MKREHLTPDAPRDLMREYVYAVFSADELSAELEQLAKALQTAPEEVPTDITEDEWRAFIADVHQYLGPCRPGDDTVRAWVHEATDRERSVLALQVRRALAALAYALKVCGEDYDPTTTVLLPVSYAQRVELLLGMGMLPVAWIRRLDLLKF